MAPGHGPLRLPGVLEAEKSEAATRRTGIAQAIEEGPPAGALLALAPLFERYEPTAVAAALYQLWTQPGEQAPAPAPAPAAPAQPFGDIPATAKLWVGIGKKDNVTANDLVATLTREVRVDRNDIGKIDIRELYTLVELPAKDIERIGQALNGLTIKKRRVNARVDRGKAGRTGGPSRRAD
jgi:ATP-dependent RNA helicase DeaD